MEVDSQIVVLTAALLGVSILLWNSGCRTGLLTAEQILDGVGAQPELVEHGKSFEPARVITVTDGVHVAFGYALANSIMLEGPEGLVIVDTTETVATGAQILKEFRRISSKPIVAIIFTHNHGDHTYGAEAFIEDPENPPDIWGHEQLAELSLETILVGPKMYRGYTHQFGIYLDEQVLTDGLGRRLYKAQPKVSLFPNKLIHGDYMSVKLAGLDLVFLHVPGETKDQIAVWLPDKRVLLPADDIYRTFPNLYAIRGTPPRNSMEWHDSLAKMRQLRAEFLVPSHTQPILGEDEIYNTFTVYMAGIQFVHDQTVRYINQGLHPDEISRKIQLPQSLATHEYLQQFYGTTVWSSKGVYETYVGWFSGDPVELFPHTFAEKAKMMIELVGQSKLLSRAETALKESDPSWALELSSYIFAIEPDNTRAKDVRLRALRALAEQQTNPLARNFYLTTALDDNKIIEWNLDRSKIIEGLQMKQLLDMMKYRLKAEETEGVNMSLLFHFTDTKETFHLQLLHSVLTINQLESLNADSTEERSYDAKLTTSTDIWKDIVLRRRTPTGSYLMGNIRIEGSLFKLRTFLSYMDRTS